MILGQENTHHGEHREHRNLEVQNIEFKVRTYKQLVDQVIKSRLIFGKSEISFFSVNSVVNKSLVW